MSKELEFAEQYEYARARLKQKKRLYYHFVIFGLMSVLIFLVQLFSESPFLKEFYVWFILVWFIIFIYHFIKVYITDKFMNKKWEKIQIERLMKKQQVRMAEIEKDLAKDQTN